MMGGKAADTDYMKLSLGKVVFLLFFCFVHFPAWCQVTEGYSEQGYFEEEMDGLVDFQQGGGISTTLPSLLVGLWENNQRIISFENIDSASIVLKLFYGWYYDRAAEPGATRISTMSTTQIDYNYSGNSQQDFFERNSVTEEVLQYEDIPERPRNDATSPEAQHLLVEFEALIPETETSGAWNVWITYPDVKERAAIPIAVFDGKLYIDFFLAQDFGTSRFYQSASNTNGMTIAPPLLAKEIYSYLVTGSRMYKIRYWQTDMEYDGETHAILAGEDGNHEVPKHLLVGDTVYTCVAGRRVEIRNIEEIPYDISGFAASQDNRILVKKDAYLIRMDIESSEYYQLIAEANSRKAPPPPPPIPLGDLDFNYDKIEDLRKYMIPQPEFPDFDAWEFIKTATYQTF